MNHLFILFGYSKSYNDIPYYEVDNLQELWKMKSRFTFDEDSFNSAVNLFHNYYINFSLCIYDKEFSATIGVSKYDYINIL